LTRLWEGFKIDYQYPELKLESHEIIAPVKLFYETFGQLNEAKDNAILIFHALSGDAHVSGEGGWWSKLVGPGKAFDTDRYFVICANTLGGCSGSTGPKGLNFPIITIKDMVAAQVPLLDHLGIKELVAVGGGSMGGMMALQLSVDFQGLAKNIIAIATSAKSSAQNIAFNEVGRRAIINDPEEGLAIARMIGHITYLSEVSLTNKFGRKIQQGAAASQKFGDPLFEVESYLKYKGVGFTKRFDANSYLYITKAIDLFDITNDLSRGEGRFLVVHFTSDWLFPEYQALDIVDRLKNSGKNVSYRVIESNAGHDAFLLEEEKLGGAIKSFLAGAKK